MDISLHLVSSKSRSLEDYGGSENLDDAGKLLAKNKYIGYFIGSFRKLYDKPKVIRGEKLLRIGQ